MSKIIATLYAVMDKRPPAGAFLRDGTSVSRMYVLGPITFRREDQ